MLAVGHDGVAMASGELLLARVAVVDHDYKPALGTFRSWLSTAVIPTEGFSPGGGTCFFLQLECGGDAVHPHQRRERRFNPLPFFRMNAVAIQKLGLSCGNRCEALAEAPVLETNPQCAAMVHDLDRQRVEEFVAEDDDVFFRLRGSRFD